MVTTPHFDCGNDSSTLSLPTSSIKFFQFCFFGTICIVPPSMESWVSGLNHIPAKDATLSRVREFESHTLRHCNFN